MSIYQSVPACSIKPIETFWKGYRFRSRLEARWAVFFEELGICWEYESQGFELRDGTRYLPDFYLPDQNLYVEIKPAIDYKPKRVYIAGKIEDPNKDWRLNIYPSYPYKENSLPGYHTYVGPYPLMGGGHGFPVPNTHGLASNGIIDENIYESQERFYPNFVVRNCLENIDLCDVLFAWISTLDCYGTIAEIGYARGKNKQIFIGIYEDLAIPTSRFTDYNKPHNIDENHDLWFVERMATDFVRSKSPLQAFEHFLVKLPEPFKKIRQINNGLLIAGNPYPGEYTAYQNWDYGPLEFIPQVSKFLSINHDGLEGISVESALLKARAARFEYGEQP